MHRSFPKKGCNHSNLEVGLPMLLVREWEWGYLWCFSFLWLLHNVFLTSLCHLISSWFAREDWSWRKRYLLLSNNQSTASESHESNVRFISMPVACDRCFSPNKYPFLLCKDVFPLQIGGNDIGSTLSSSWGSLFLCQRTRRVGKQDWKPTWKPIAINKFVSEPIFCLLSPLLLGPCAVSWCKYYIFVFSYFLRFSSA